MTERTCKTCEYAVPRYDGSGRRFCNGPHRYRFSDVRGGYTDPTNCEYERWSFWRWLGFDTCGPSGRYWLKAAVRIPPKVSARDE
jgi:hypothetical protein